MPQQYSDLIQTFIRTMAYRFTEEQVLEMLYRLYLAIQQEEWIQGDIELLSEELLAFHESTLESNRDVPPDDYDGFREMDIMDINTDEDPLF